SRYGAEPRVQRAHVRIALAERIQLLVPSAVRLPRADVFAHLSWEQSRPRLEDRASADRGWRCRARPRGLVTARTTVRCSEPGRVPRPGNRAYDTLLPLLLLPALPVLPLRTRRVRAAAW